MSTKTKTVQSTFDQLTDVAQHVGLVLMTAAATISMLELPDRMTKIVIPSQPALALAGERSESPNTLRREKEEVDQHYISYSVAQRTPGRTGKQ